MSRCGSCPIYDRKRYGIRCDGDHGVEECADKLQELYYAMRADGPIEKALEDWGAEITGINTLLGCCELLAGLAEEATELAQAALKMRRTLDKSNPTPMTTGDASRNLNEEFADVLLCAAVLGFDREEIDLRYADGEALSLYTPGIEDSFDTTLPMRTEMDWLIYNAPLEYAQMALDGTLEQYLREAAGMHGLED